MHIDKSNEFYGKKKYMTYLGAKVNIELGKDFLELRGSLKTNKKSLSNEKLHDFLAKTIANKVIKSTKKLISK